MKEITKDQLTPIKVVLPYFIFSGMSLLILSIMITMSSESFNFHYFQPRLLAITHFATLGFITSIIFGSLYLILPVVLQVNLYSKKLASVTFYFLLTGVIVLCCCFWEFRTGLPIQLGAGLVFFSFLLFSINFYISVRKSKEWKIEADLISTSLIWLLLTGLIGVLLAFNFTYPLVSVSHLEILKLHAHIGFLGWVFLLIAGVASKLIPMFFIVHVKSKSILYLVYYFTNAGLILLSVVLYFSLNAYLLYLSISIISVGIFLFFTFVVSVFRKRIRGKFDIGLKLSMIAFLFLIGSVIISFIIPSNLLNEKNRILLSMSYGLAGFLGFAGTLILGQSLKIVPFIIWIHKYSKMAGKKNIPLPKDLVSEKVSIMIMGFFLTGLILLLVAIPLQVLDLIKAAGGLLIMASVCHNINLYKVIIHKAKH